VSQHTLPEPDPARTARLRDALRAADFTADGCLELLGATAYAALSRGETVPAARAATRAGGGLATLVRLFLLQHAVDRDRAAAALPLREALAGGWLVEDAAGRVRATVDVRPYAGPADDAAQDWWIVSDLGCAVGGAGGIGSAVAPGAHAAAAAAEGAAHAPTADAAGAPIADAAGTPAKDAAAAGAPAAHASTAGAAGASTAGAAGASTAGAAGVPAAPDRSQLVLGVGGASTTLAGITVRTPARTALDLGTGSGVQALHAASRGARVTATDVNPRALRFAALTALLSGVPVPELRQGSLFEPVAGERFDLIVSNPPFVISPGERFVYRDGGMAGDDLCRTLVGRAGDHLTEGGYCQLLANWQHVEGEDWRERVTSWLPPGCDAWIVQREVQDPAAYAELWLRDGGDHRADPASYAARYDAWLEEFERRKVSGVGFGWITLRRSDAAVPTVTAEEWPHPVEQPLGPEIERWFARQDFLRAHDDAALLGARFRLADGVLQEQVGLPGAEDPEHVVLRAARGMRRATTVDTVGAGFAGVCDGSLTAGRILDAIAQLLGQDPVILRDSTPAAIRTLVEQGFLVPVE
jgi:methylase of polypeptide subunit release factors